MTDRDIAGLSEINRFVIDHHYGISFGELAPTLGLVSRSSVHRWVRLMEAEGYVAMLPHQMRSLHLTDKGEELLRDLWKASVAESKRRLTEQGL